MSKITNDGLTRSGTGCTAVGLSHGNSGRQRVNSEKLSIAYRWKSSKMSDKWESSLRHPSPLSFRSPANIFVHGHFIITVLTARIFPWYISFWRIYTRFHLCFGFDSKPSDFLSVNFAHFIDLLFQPMWSQFTNVTDRQTDRRTDRRHAIAIPRFALKCIAR